MDRADVNAHVTRMAKRAEKAPDDVLRDSFVPVPALLAQLTTNEHQVLYGRRGTGKTHLLRHLQDRLTGDGALVVYMDLRTVGAAEDVFSVQQEDFAEHATRLLVDVVEHVHTQVLDQLLTERFNDRLTQVSAALDRLYALAVGQALSSSWTTSTTASTDPRLRDGCGSEKGCVRNRMGAPGDYFGVDFMLRSGITQSNTW